MSYKGQAPLHLRCAAAYGVQCETTFIIKGRRKNVMKWDPAQWNKKRKGWWPQQSIGSFVRDLVGGEDPALQMHMQHLGCGKVVDSARPSAFLQGHAGVANTQLAVVGIVWYWPEAGTRKVVLDLGASIKQARYEMHGIKTGVRVCFPALLHQATLERANHKPAAANRFLLEEWARTKAKTQDARRPFRGGLF